MNPMREHPLLAVLLLNALIGSAAAAPATYNIDPDHTHPSFEADHMGISVWRGKFNKSSGKVNLDKGAGRGTVEVNVATDSIDFGHDKLNKWAISAELLDAKRYPRATFKGQLEGFADGAPAHAVGELTLHGVTKPFTLTINAFKCVPHPLFKRDYCGADLQGSLNREDFGMPVGKEWGFKMDVTLRIQVEAIAAE